MFKQRRKEMHNRRAHFVKLEKLDRLGKISVDNSSASNRDKLNQKGKYFNLFFQVVGFDL